MGRCLAVFGGMLVVFTAGAAAQLRSPATVVTVTGTVVLDPAQPVCRIDRPCTKLLPDFKLVFWRNGDVAARTKTNSRGHYRVMLKPGDYRVTHPPKGLGAGLTPKRISVPASARVTRKFRYDAGIR